MMYPEAYKPWRSSVTKLKALTAAARPYLGAALVVGLAVAAGPALADIPTGGIDTFRDDIWNFFIENVGLMVIGLGLLGAILGAMIAQPGRGLAQAVVVGALGCMLAAVPAMAEYFLGLGG